MKRIRLPFPAPYCAQVASPALAQAIFEEGLDPCLDPRWAETGAVSPAEYAHWVDRNCGIACVKMVVEALGGEPRPILEWTREGVRRGGYLVTADENGAPVERGWVHRVLADLIIAAGFTALARPAALEEIPRFLADGQIGIASVSFELGKDGPVTHSGGHLVVVCGADVEEDGTIDCFYINNPSGRRPVYQANARIERDRFRQAYSGRMILASR